MDELHYKKRKLESSLSGLGSVAVAFSGGVDSSFLLYEAHSILGDRAIALTAQSPLFPKKEFKETIAFCAQYGIRQIVYEQRELNNEIFNNNPSDRCYLCKKELFSEFLKLAAQNGVSFVVEGSNTDDTGDYRPGLAAVSQLGIISPLRLAELTKADIRALSKEAGLKTYDKPSFACLATRFVYGEEITREKLNTVEKAEQKLFELGFKQVRVRVHGNIARIEIERSQFEKMLGSGVSDAIDEYFKSLGFMYVTLDLDGYCTGSMNRAIQSDKSFG